MSWDKTPWAIGGGAEHSPEVARLLAYASTSGAEGIVNSGDLKVRELSVPGSSVTVDPGAALIRNRSTGGDDETYVGRLPSQDTVNIAATGAGAGRSDLIVVQIEDPFLAGSPWADPADPTTAQYIFTRVISNVPAGTTTLQEVAGYENRTAITLARVDMPASTGTVIEDYIVDLRGMALPRAERKMKTIYPSGYYYDGTAHGIPTGGYSSWPIRSSERPLIWVPEWATHLDVVAHFPGVYFDAGTTETAAGVRTGFGTLGSQNGILVADQSGRGHYSVVGSHYVEPSQRGTYQYLNIQGVRSSGDGLWWADYQTSVLVDYQLTERPE